MKRLSYIQDARCLKVNVNVGERKNRLKGTKTPGKKETRERQTRMKGKKEKMRRKEKKLPVLWKI